MIARVIDVRSRCDDTMTFSPLFPRDVTNQVEHPPPPRVHPFGRLVRGRAGPGHGPAPGCLMRGFMPAEYVSVLGTALRRADVVQHLVRARCLASARGSPEAPQYATNDTAVHAGDMRVGFRHVPDTRPNRQRGRAYVEAKHPLSPRSVFTSPNQRLIIVLLPAPLDRAARRAPETPM